MIVALGFLGSALLAVGGFGVGAPPTRLDIPLALPMCLLGLGFLLVAWWLLRRSSAREVLVAAGAWSLPLLVAPPLFSRDVYAYAGQAQLVLSGLDPYDVGPSSVPGPLADEVDDVWADTPSPYGPVFLWLAARVVAVTGERPLAAAYGLRLLAVVGVLLIAWALPRLARSAGVPPERALWLGLANPLLLLHGVAGAHNDVLMIGLLAAGLALSSRIAVAAVLITLAALVKAPAAAGLAFLPLLGTPVLRRYLVTGLAAGLTCVVVAPATGLGWGWLTTLDAGGARRSLLSPTTGIGVLVGAVDAAHVAGLGVAVLLSGYLLVRARDLGPLLALGLALLAVVVLGPVVQPWYLLWAVVLLAAVVPARAATGLAAASAVLCLLVLPSGRHLIRPPLYGVPLVVVAVVGACVWRTPGRPRGPRAPR